MMKLISTPARGILFGFLCTLVLVGLFVLVSNLRPVGGQDADSPDGRYGIRVFTGLNPVSGDPYIVELEERSSGTVLRRLEINLSSDEKAEPLRGGPRVIQWSPKSDYADVQIGQKPVVRVFVP
jgi:hypothetical protein